MKSITLLDIIKNKSFTWYDNAGGTILREFSGFEYPSTNNSFQDLPSRLGAYYSASKFSTRRLSWQGDLVGASIFANRRLMLAPMSQDELKLLKFTTYDDLQLQCEVAIDKMTFPYTNSVHTFLIEAIASDWRFYSQTLTEKIFGITDLLGGTSIPTSIPIDLNNDGIADDNIVVNAGDEDTFPIITIKGAGSTFVVGNSANNQSFTLNVALEAGEEVVIDCKNRTVMFGSTNLFDAFDGDFIMLESGDNTIAFSCTGDGVDTSIKFEYRSAYRGI